MKNETIRYWPAFALGLVLSLSALAQDRAFDRFKHYDALYNNGQGDSLSGDGADLGWGESQFLDSYINTYRAYRDTYWLDKIVEHFDTVKSNATNLGSGNYGWPTPIYSYQHLFNNHFEIDGSDANEAEVLANGGFETAGADSVPASWVREAGTNTTVLRTTTAGQYFSGTAGLAILYNAGSAATLRSDTFTLSPGRRYNLTFMAKTNAITTTAKLEVYKVVSGVYTLVAGTPDLNEGAILKDAWVENGLSFTAGLTAGETYVVKLRLGKLDQSGWAVYLDDLSIKPVETIVNAIENGTFETAAAGDSTLPDKWTRYGSNTLAYLSSVAGEYHTGSKGFVVKSDGVDFWNLAQRIAYTPGATYTLTFWGKTTSGATGRVMMYNATDVIVEMDQTFSGTTWAKQSYTFTAPSTAGKVLYLYLRQSNYTDSSWIVYYDDVKIEPYVENVNENYGFESVSGSLPVGWERYQSTSSNAYVSVDVLNEYYSYNTGVVIKSNNASVPMLRKQIYLNPGMPYTVRYRGRVNVPSAQGQVEIYNQTTSSSIASDSFSSVDWAGRAFTFTAPSSITDAVSLRLRQSTTAPNDEQITYFDDVEVVPAVPRGFAGWTRVNKTTANSYASRKYNEFVGGAGLVIGNDGSTSGYIKQQLRGYDASKSYSVYYYARTNNSGNGAKVVVYNVTAGTQLATKTSTETTWGSRQQLHFTTPASVTDVVEIRLMQQSDNNSADFAYFDGVSVGERAPWLVHETMVARPILKFIKTVKSDSALNTIYGTKADEYLDFIEDQLLPKWDAYYTDLGGGNGVYLVPTGNRSGGSFSGRTLPHNQYLVAAECYLLLGDIQSNSTYTTRASSLLNFFKSKLSTNSAASTAYEWPYWSWAGSWDNGLIYGSYEEDSSHGNLDVSAAIMGYRYGVVFSAADMDKFASTFIDAMWNGSLTSPNIGPAVDLDAARTEWLWFNADLWGWLQLAEIDPDVWKVGDALMQYRIEDFRKTSSSFVRNVMAALALYNPEMLVNGDFESVSTTDSTLPAYWQRYLTPTTYLTAYRDTSNAYLGKAGFASKTNGTAWNITQQTMVNYLPSTPYTLSFRGKVGTTSVQARADVFNYTPVTLVGSTYVTSTSWQSASLAFTTPSSASDDLRVDLYHNIYTPAGYFAYFDDVRVFAELWDSFAPNGGFEEVESYDTTLPRYWTRTGTTLAANAVVTNGDKLRGNNSVRLAPSGGTAQQLIYRVRDFVPGASYTVSFQGKTTGTCGAKIRLRNETGASDLGSTSVTASSWSAGSFTITAPSSATDELRIYLELNNTSGTGYAYFDQVGFFLN